MLLVPVIYVADAVKATLRNRQSGSRSCRHGCTINTDKRTQLRHTLNPAPETCDFTEVQRLKTLLIHP